MDLYHPPALLEQYDCVLPGSAERIFVMAERQSNHRQALEKVIVNSDSKRAYLGLLSGLIVALVVVISGAFLIFNGHDWAGATMVTGIVVALSGIFVYGSKVENQKGFKRLKAFQMKDQLNPKLIFTPELQLLQQDLEILPAR